MKNWQRWWSLVLGGAVLSCAHSKPATHVELVRADGHPTYVGGAAAPGMSRSTACASAVHRAVAAIAERFARENKGVGKKVAREVGASGGGVFLQRYAKESALDAAVQDVQFDPSKHLCMATVRWRSPIFVQDAVLKFAQQVRSGELGEDQGGGDSRGLNGSEVQQSGSERESGVAFHHPPPPLGSASSPSSHAKPKPVSRKAVPQCRAERKKMARARKTAVAEGKQLKTCLSKTQGDETVCHGYQLRAQKGREGEVAAAGALARCFNTGLSSALQGIVAEALPGHAALVIETKTVQQVLVWTFSPLEHSAFSVVVDLGQGEALSPQPLDAQQTQWLRERLSL